MFQSFEKKLEEILGIKYISKENEKEDSKKEFYELAKGAQNTVFVVAGELTSRLYDAEFPGIIAEKIRENENFKVNLLFSKTASSRDEAIAKIKEENPKIVSVFRNNSKNIKMYLAKKRPRFHFDIFDNNLRLEKPHKAGDSKAVLVERNKKEMAEKYQEYFKKMCERKEIVSELFPEEFK